ncbi:Oligopeptide-binding protein AppA [bacterium HR33]|nr:Oligopeptide-binding protein AppA [bacterium HR33]
MLRRARATLGLLLGPLIAAGCAESNGCEGDWCGTAVIVGADADVLFPPTMQGDVANAIVDLVFLKLADIGADLNTLGDAGFEPRLARSWTFEDSVTIRFQLDPRARWHDGRPVTASDVEFTFEIYRDTLVNSPQRPMLDRIAAVTAADSLSVVFRFDRFYPEQFFDAVHHMRILPRHWLDTIPRRELAAHPFTRNPVGNGPYRLVRWNRGESIELAGDSTFFLGRPGLRRIIWQVVADPGVGITRLVAGEADVLNFIGTPENLARVRQAPHLRTVSYRSNQYAYIGFNFRNPARQREPHPIFAERDLRRALSMAVDRAAVVDAVLGELGTVLEGPITSFMWIWSDTLKALPFDSARARRTLEQLGWIDRDGDGVRERGGLKLAFELLVPTTSQLRRRAAVIVQEQLRRVGAAMSINELDWSTFLSRAAAGQFDAIFGAWALDPSPRQLRQYWGSPGIGGFNYQKYRSPEFDRLVERASATGDRAQALELWHRAIGVITQDAPAIWIYAPRPVAAVHRRFENVTIRSDQWAATLWTWRVSPDNLLPRDRIAVH